ncbi:MAG: PAS domain-containing sensor histidine kinase [Chloroflexi bacterium]|nr:PAS domain-containing sensor histidine kinase [Chloroflexota bacterium]
MHKATAQDSVVSLKRLNNGAARVIHAFAGIGKVCGADSVSRVEWHAAELLGGHYGRSHLSILRGRELRFLLLLIGVCVWLWFAFGPNPVLRSGFFHEGFAVMLLIMVGSVARPFTGGNEAEWIRYLEELVRSERDRVMAILNSMEEGVVIIDLDRKIRFMNPSMVREFGDGVGLHCYRHLRGLDEPCGEICRLPNVIRGKNERWEYIFPDGRTYDVIGSPFADLDQVPCMLATFRNITQRKQAEIELVKLNQLKSDLLSQKTRELEEISREVAKLEEQERRFVRFLRVVAHDLQSPLAATQTCLWDILDGYCGKITDEQRDMLERSSRRIDGLSTLIGDLLDIPRIEAGQIVHEMKETSLSEVIERSVDELSNLAKEKGITLKVELPQSLPRIHGSSIRLQQVVRNLISNAIKYSREGTVLVRATEDEGDLRVEVIDSGIGILPEDLPLLFTDFFRGKNVETRGTGLGLSISKRIVEAHGGRIWAESPCPETGKGSKFSFTLPKVAGPQDSSVNQNRPEPRLSK